MPALLSQRSASIQLLLLTAVCSAICGCGSADALVPVHGLVVVDGQPISGASVTFCPAAGGVASVAVTDVSGRFSLRTQDDRRGALEGFHQIAVIHPDDLSRTPDGTTPGLRNAAFAAEAEEAETIVPRKYTNLSTSGLTVEVQHDKSEPVYLKLER